MLLAITTLNKKVDSDSGEVSKHLGEIADSMVEWEGKIAEELGLTDPEVEAIKCQWPLNIVLQK